MQFESATSAKIGNTAVDWYDEDECNPDRRQVASEYFDKAPALGPESKAWLAEQGVPEDAMAGISECRSGYVITGADYEFRIDPPEGSRTGAVGVYFHVPVIRDGEFVDLIRFNRTPCIHVPWGGRVCRRATWLGEPLQAASADGWPVPTPIWRTPLGWLRCGRKGLVYLRNSWPTWRLGLLRSLPAVIGESTAHALQLDKMAWRGAPKPRHWSRVPCEREMVRHIARRVAGQGVAA